MKTLALKYYLDNDYSIIPLGPDKRPIISSWSIFQKQKADEGQITAWWLAHPKANIGIITGAISGITVVDIDNKDGKAVPLDTFPPTYTVRTPSGGYHLYYKYDETIKQTANTYSQFPHVDIRNDGGYVVGAGSVTNYGENEGGTYTIFADNPVAVFPTSLFNPQGKETTKKKKKLPEVIGVAEGNGGNSAMTSLAGKLISKWPEKEWDTEVWPALMQFNQTFKPPFSTAELTTIYESICKIERKRLSGEGSSENEEEAALVTSFKNSAKKGTYDLAMYIVKKYRIITVGEVEKEIYVYRDGMYMRAENEVIYPEIQRILKSHVNKSAKLETLHKIADATFRNRDVFKSAPYNLIPLKNGVYDTDTGNLLPHSHEYCFTFQFPIVYDATKLCPKSLQFMQQVLSPDQFLTVQEWLGYYFYRLYAFKKAIIFVGEGDTGKTTLLEMMTHLLGRQNISSISLQKMTGDKFSAAHMYEKHGNIVDELSAKDIHDTGQFKIATGGGAINGEHKFGNQFSFLNYSKLTFACNKIPDVKEMDDTAYFNRWMVIRFEKTIQKKIPNFIAQLTTEDERSGLFTFAMVGLKRLLEQGSFTYAKSAIDTKLEMMRSGSSIAQFASEGVREKQGSEITKEKLYDEYVEYCTRLDLAVETMDLFSKKFMFYVAYVSDKSMYNLAGKRVRGWMNVEVIKQVETIHQELEADKEFEAMKEHAVDNL